jgi:hypothetical protein
MFMQGRVLSDNVAAVSGDNHMKPVIPFTCKDIMQCVDGYRNPPDYLTVHGHSDARGSRAFLRNPTHRVEAMPKERARDLRLLVWPGSTFTSVSGMHYLSYNLCSTHDAERATEH